MFFAFSNTTRLRLLAHRWLQSYKERTLLHVRTCSANVYIDLDIMDIVTIPRRRAFPFQLENKGKTISLDNRLFNGERKTDRK